MSHRTATDPTIPWSHGSHPRERLPRPVSSRRFAPSETAPLSSAAEIDPFLSLPLGMAVYMFFAILVAFAFKSAILMRFEMPSGEACLCRFLHASQGSMRARSDESDGDADVDMAGASVGRGSGGGASGGSAVSGGEGAGEAATGSGLS